MGKRIALTTLTAAAPLALLSFLLPTAASPALFTAAATLFPVALMALGASGRGGALGAAALPIFGLAGALTLVMAGLFHFRGAGIETSWWGGLPASAAVLIYGLFLLPFCLSSLGYAWTFERCGLTPEDLDGLRSRFPESLDAYDEVQDSDGSADPAPRGEST